MPSPRRRTPLQAVPYPYLVIVPALLAAATVVSLFFHSNVDAALLWSQCHARERIPALSTVPGLGTALCYLISFFQAAMDSLRTKGAIGIILSFVGALLTVTTVEAARVCNAPNAVIAYPTGPWLVFNLIGGAVVWELVIIPAFLYRDRMMLLLKGAGSHGGGDESGTRDGAAFAEEGRRLAAAESIAIPISVALGYYLPSIAMVATNHPAAIGVWLFFPVHVSLIRQAARWTIRRVRQTTNRPVKIHLESTWWPLIGVYALPITCSIAAQVAFIWSLTLRDDRKEITRSTFRFIEIDVLFTGLTVLYWLLVEVGWRVPSVMVVTSVVAGPGTGVCLGWLSREKEIHHGYMGQPVQAAAEPEDLPGEERPLLQ